MASQASQVDKSPYAFTWNNPINLVDPDGLSPDTEMEDDRVTLYGNDGMKPEDIIIKGGKKFRNQALANLQALTDDVLTIDKNGKVSIQETSCNQGCEVARNVVSKLINNEEATVTIVKTNEGNKTTGGHPRQTRPKKDGTPGPGAKKVKVHFNPYKKEGGLDVNGNKERPTEIGLVHELFHAENKIEGMADVTSSGVLDPDGSGIILDKEELSVRKKENKVRKERGVPLRKIK